MLDVRMDQRVLWDFLCLKALRLGSIRQIVTARSR